MSETGVEQSYEWNVEQTSGTEDVDYVKRIKESSRIYFKQAGRIDLALKSENPEVNLFHLFLPTSYIYNAQMDKRRVGRQREGQNIITKI